MNALCVCGSWGPIKPVWIWNHFLERKQPCRKPNQRTCILLLTSPDLDKFKFSQNNKTLTNQIFIKKNHNIFKKTNRFFLIYFFLEVLQCSCLWIIACLMQKENGAIKGRHLPIQIVAAKVPIIDDAPGPPAFWNHLEGEQEKSVQPNVIHKKQKTSDQTLW